MQEIEDPALKLFGKKIPLSISTAATCEVKWMDGEEEEEEEEEAGDVEEETEQGVAIDEQSQSQVPLVEEGEGASEASKSVKESSCRGKTLKKPDKILPCPRCNSMDTKFCYYNNYNVNQPRHFCRACQRYWTAGGMMRSMAVGAGRRKNKSVSCRYRHIMISRTLEGANIDVKNSVQLSDMKINGTVLRFGADIEKQGEDCSSSASSITVSNSTDNGSGSFGPDCNGIASQYPCIPGFPWPYPWSPPVPPPAFYPAAAFWTWNVPFVLSQQPSSPDNHRTSIPSTDSATLGKRLWDSHHPQPEVESPKQRNSCLVVPKIRRIDDPDEAAKSSIWASLGIKPDANIKGEELSGGFQRTGSGKVRGNEKLRELHANPAALSRSLNFHENNCDKRRKGDSVSFISANEKQNFN